MKLTLIGFGLLLLQGCASSDTLLRDQYNQGFNDCKAEDQEDIQYIRGQREILNGITADQVAKIRMLEERLRKCKK